MQQAEWMDQLVYDLIARYTAEVLPSGLIRLELTMPGHGVLVIEELIKQQQMRVAYLLFTVHHQPVPEPELLFYIDPAGHWIPYAINRITSGRYEFADLDIIDGQLLVTDVKNQAALALFADFWAETLRVQGWLEQATQSHISSLLDSSYEPPWPDWETLRRWLWWLEGENGCTATNGC